MVIAADDIDGSEGAVRVRFQFDGADYEINLAPASRAKLDGALAPFIAAARRSRTGSRSGSNGSRASAARDRAAIRAWARESGLHVSGRGRISADVVRQYEAGHR